MRIARGYIGTPWVHQGRTPKGLDCLGLPMIVAIELGFVTTDYTGYDETRADWPELLRRMRKMMTKDKEIQLGSVILFRYLNMPHVAIAADKGNPWSIIHSHRGRRRVVEASFGREWVEKMRGSWSFIKE